LLSRPETTGSFFQVKVAARHVPLAAAHDFDAPALKVVVETWNRISETIADFLFGKRIVYRPDAQFPVLKASSKIGNTGIDKVFFGFMEKEEMGSPGNVANNTDSSRPQLFICHSHLHAMVNLIDVSSAIRVPSRILSQRGIRC
jgi:hypothetical protein